MSDNISLRSIVSIFFVMFVIGGAEGLIPGLSGMLWFTWLFVLFTIPMIDYILKAYYKVYCNSIRPVSTFGRILNYLFLGIPFLFYGYFSLCMQYQEDCGFSFRKEEKIGLWVLGVGTLGIVPVAFFLLYGPVVIIQSIVFKTFRYIADTKYVVFGSLIAGAILSMGISLVVLLLFAVIGKLAISFLSWRPELRMRIYEYVVILVAAYFTKGILLMVLATFYYVFEMIYMDIKTSNNDKTGVNTFMDFIETREELLNNEELYLDEEKRKEFIKSH